MKGLKSAPSPPRGFGWPSGSPSPVVEEGNMVETRLSFKEEE